MGIVNDAVTFLKVNVGKGEMVEESALKRRFSITLKEAEEIAKVLVKQGYLEKVGKTTYKRI